MSLSRDKKSPAAWSTTQQAVDTVLPILARLAPIPAAEWRYTEQRLTLRILKPGEALTRAGEVANCFGFIASGLMRKVHVTEQGRSVVRGFARAGDLVGAYASILSGEPSYLCVEALETTRLFVFETAELPRLYARDACWQQVGRRIAEELLLERETRAHELLTLSATERYTRFCASHQELLPRLRNYDIASYLGITPVSLSRLRARKQREPQRQQRGTVPKPTAKPAAKSTAKPAPTKPKTSRATTQPDATLALANTIRSELEAEGTEERARGAKAYMKSELGFLGVTVPELRRQVKSFARAHRALSKAELIQLVTLLWQANVHELRSFAIGLLEQRVKGLDSADLPWLIALVDDADGWAHVDWLATKVVGAIVAADARTANTLRKWAKHSNFWVRRTAILALHDPLLAGKGNFELLAELAVPMLGEREFFIRKAIGWVLRSAAKRRPELTTAFVEQHAPAMAGLTFKEATRNLPANVQARLLRLRNK